MSDDFIDPSTINDEIPDDAALTSVSALAEEAKQLEADIVQKSRVLQTALVRYRQLTQVDLPRALDRVGHREFVTSSGTKVGIVTKLDSKQLSTQEGLQWVEKNGGGSLIKTVITVELDRGDIDVAREIMAQIRAHRAANRFKGLTLEEVVNAQTIAKFARELIEKGKDPPLQLLGVHQRSYAVVGKRPKTVELKGFADER